MIFKTVSDFYGHAICHKFVMSLHGILLNNYALFVSECLGQSISLIADEVAVLV